MRCSSYYTVQMDITCKFNNKRLKWCFLWMFYCLHARRGYHTIWDETLNTLDIHAAHMHCQKNCEYGNNGAWMENLLFFQIMNVLFIVWYDLFPWDKITNNKTNVESYSTISETHTCFLTLISFTILTKNT